MYIDDPDVADYSRPRNFNLAKLKAEADAIVLPDDLQRCLTLWNNVLKMPAETYAQKMLKRLCKERVYPHLVKLQQASPVIQTDGGIRVAKFEELRPVRAGEPLNVTASPDSCLADASEPISSVPEPSLFSRVRKLFRVYW